MFKSIALFKSLLQPYVGHGKVIDAMRFISSETGGSPHEGAWRIEAFQHNGYGTAAANSRKSEVAGGIIILSECKRPFVICMAGGAHALVEESLA